MCCSIRHYNISFFSFLLITDEQIEGSGCYGHYLVSEVDPGVGCRVSGANLMIRH